jgi:hypothetical protein
MTRRPVRPGPSRTSSSEARATGLIVEKLIYLVWLPDGTTRSAVREVMLGEVAPALLAAGPRALTMDLDDEDADVASPVPGPDGEAPVRAVVSLWVDAYDWRAPFESVLNAVAERLAGYQVVESLYGDYGSSRWSEPRWWPDGERSPGLLTVALFNRPPDMAFEDWITFWHTKQSPMSEAVQPRCRYVRNAVFRPVTADAPPYQAIVEEAWPSAAHVTDPMLFFCADGDPEKMKANMATMIQHVEQFIDLGSMRSLTMSEWILRS